MIRKIAAFISTIGPGIFLIGYNIGTGSITTMAVSGSSYGMTLIWPLFLSCLFTFYLIITFGKYTAITGNTVLYSFKSHFGKGISLFVLIALILSEWVSCIGVMAIVVQTVQEWSRPLTEDGSGFHPVILATIFGILLYVIFWQGQYKVFERLLAVFVSIMGICFIMTMFMVIPEGSELFSGLVPNLPSGNNKLLVMAGMAGTTMGAILYVVRSILVQEKGWTMDDIHIERRDALISVLLMFVLSVSVMASAAGTLYPKGIQVENAIDMVNLLEPLAGRFAVSLFVAGIVSAGLSSFFPIALLAPWLIADYSHTPRNLQSIQSRLLVLFAISLGLIVPIFGGRPVWVMIISQAGIAIASPIVLILMFVLINKKTVMGNYTAKPLQNIILIVIISFSIFMAGAGLIGIFG